MPILFDYVTLKIIWWLLVGVLLIGFAVMDGFDIGVGTLLPFRGKNDDERRVIINSVGPTWEGNQVWFITGGGALFAAWPLVYCRRLLGFLLGAAAGAVRAVLPAGGLRLPQQGRRPALAQRLGLGAVRRRRGAGAGLRRGLRQPPAGGAVPPSTTCCASYYSGNFFGLLNPFALLTGVVSLVDARHARGDLSADAHRGRAAPRGPAARRASSAWSSSRPSSWRGSGMAFGIQGYRIVSMPDPGGVVVPLAKTVEKVSGAWMATYAAHPWMWLAPVLAVGGGLWRCCCRPAAARGWPSCFSAAALAGTILTAGFAMFPFVMPSSTFPNASLTVYDAVSSHRTLNLMFVAVVLFLPRRPALHELGLPRAAGQGDREAHSGGNAFGVLRPQAGERHAPCRTSS